MGKTFLYFKHQQEQGILEVKTLKKASPPQIFVFDKCLLNNFFIFYKVIRCQI